MATNYYESFVDKLEEIFMMDHAELDFGIYRIMNQKRDEITTFLRQDLLPQVQEVLATVGSGNDAELKAHLTEIEKQAASFGISPDKNPDYQTLKAKLMQTTSAEALQNDVFSHLVTFFSRYYDNGDFVSKRRYKDNVYAIPYNGEEVKLHWANADQYYIKSSEYFRDYTFVLPESHRKVHFVLKDATTEQNNNKAANNMERRFAIYQSEESPCLEQNEDELSIFFTYELMPKGTKQDALLVAAMDVISPKVPEAFKELLDVKMPTAKKQDRTLLEKHLTDYTAKNSFDYFIHKDLGGFLHRELDFYIKNEVMLLDDLDTEHIQGQLATIKAIKQVGDKIIRMLAQLENFQKRLWLKKKFVVQSDYCITLDRIPEELYAEIAANDRQREEWVRLFAIDEIEGLMGVGGYSVPLTVEFLRQNPFLVMDTAFFSRQFKHRLVSYLGKKGLDEQCNGLLINSENFQALDLLQEKFTGIVKCVYIDPPYNTGDDDFAYKDSFQESSWLCCIDNRLELTRRFYKECGSFAASIDINELDKFMMLLDNALGKENRKANITVRRASITGAKVINPGPVNIGENVIVYSNGVNKWKPENAYRERDYDNRYGQMIINPQDHYEKWQFGTVLDEFAKENDVPKSQLKKKLGDSLSEELLKFVIKNKDRVIRLAALDENSVGSQVLELKKKSLKEPGRIFYLQRDDANDYYIINGNTILFYKDRLRWMGDGFAPVEKVSDIWDDVLPNDLHNEGGVQLKKGKKPEKLVNRIFEFTTNEGEFILDYFAGSATSGAVALKSNRRFINIEANEYFDEIPLRRLKNTLAGDKSGVSKLYQWKGGGCFKYQRLEQYEDTLNNLELKTPQQIKADFEGKPDTFRESYMLGYMLDTETRESLLNIKKFENPFAMTLKTTKDNELVETPVDLVETFNYLIGLNVETEEWYQDDNICVIKGRTHRDNLQTLVIWRNCKLITNEELNTFFEQKEYRICEGEWDVIYVNGDNTLSNLKRDADHWRVMLTEEEFTKRMFENE